MSLSLPRFRMSQSVVIAIGLLCLLLQGKETIAKEYVVGDKQGWDLYPEINSWPEGKNFKAGDVLIFYYNNPLYNPLAVDESHYQECDPTDPIKTYSSGHDRVVLKKGTSYFIATVRDYCGYGMKIAVDAE